MFNCIFLHYKKYINTTALTFSYFTTYIIHFKWFNIALYVILMFVVKIMNACEMQ